MPRISTCRISNSRNLISVLNLGEQQLTGVFPRTSTEPIESGPLELVWCPDSQLLQLSHSFDPSRMYGKDYGYRSSLNQSMVNHLTTKVTNLEQRFGLRPGDCVIDIGSNDATTLKAYKTPGMKRIGVDPTGVKFSAEYMDGLTLIPDFFPNAELAKIVGDSKVRMVTSIAMFYDVDDPIAFARAIAEILEPDGVWHLEQSYMPSMIRMNSYDTICHEHLEYYSLHSLKYVMDRAGLRILDVQMNSVNGGSFAVTVARDSSTLKSNPVIVDWLMEQEIRMRLDTPTPFRQFEERVYRAPQGASVPHRLPERGSKQRVLGYGASTKGNVLLQFCGFTGKDIPAIAEVNQDKFGCVTPGTSIPIVSEQEAAAMKPDYFLVLPWHFKDSIIRREQAFLASGGKLIFPLPEIEIVGG